MTSTVIAEKLREKGFAYNEGLTGKFDGYRWTGFIEPTKPAFIDGDEFSGFSVKGNTRAEMDAMALRELAELTELVYFEDEP